MKRFYLGMNYNGGGIEVAKKLIPELEKLTGHQCTNQSVRGAANRSPRAGMVEAQVVRHASEGKRITLRGRASATAMATHIY